MKKQKNNKGIMLLLIIIIFLLLGLCILFMTNRISFNSKKENITDNNNDNNIYNIETKLIDNLNNSNSETTFNNITVKINQQIDDMICIMDNVSINNTDISKHVGNCIDSYEFFDENVIILSSHTSGTILTIFSVNSNNVSLVFSSANNSELNGYFVNSYLTRNNIISISAKGCGLQCGVDNYGEVATFEIQYLNKSFSIPKLITKVEAVKKDEENISLEEEVNY